MTVMTELEERIAAIKPVIVLGDDDSIDLTPHQSGRKQGLMEALELLQAQAEEVAEETASTAPSWGYRIARLLSRFGLDFGTAESTQWAILRDAHRTIRWDKEALKAANENKDWPTLKAPQQNAPAQADARTFALRIAEETLTSYLLDYCPDEEMWEDFDPDVDSIRSAVQEAAGD